MSVLVEIVNHELRIVCSGTDVHAQVDTPELRAVQLVAVEIDVVGLVALGVVLRGGRIPFDDDLILSVAVDIAHRTVVWRVGSSLDTSLRTVQFQLEVALGPRLHSGCDIHDLPVLDSLYLEDIVNSSVRHERGSSREFRGQHLLRILNKSERDILVVCSQKSPADEHFPCRRREHHQSAVKLLHLTLRGTPRFLCMDADSPCHQPAHQ